MNKGEVVRTLSTRARIEPGFTTLGPNILRLIGPPWEPTARVRVTRDSVPRSRVQAMADSSGGDGELRVQIPAHGAGQAKVVALEKQLNWFVRSVALFERVGDGLGTLAFMWATVILLGGYPTVLRSKDDFGYATAMVFLEAARMFSRNNRLDYQLFFNTRGAFRPLGGNGLIVVVYYFAGLNGQLFLLNHFAENIQIQWILVPVIMETVMLLAIVQLLSRGAPRLLTCDSLRRVVSLWSPLVAILLFLVVSIVDLCYYEYDESDANTTLLRASCTVFLVLFVVVLLLTISRLRFPCIIKLVDTVLGSKLVLRRRVIINLCMVATIVMFMLRLNPGVTLVVCAVLIVSVGNLQIPAVVVRVVLALLRLIKQDYEYDGKDHNSESKTNLVPSLNIFYGMVLGQGILYIVACLLEFFSFIPRRSLIRRGGFIGQWGVESVNLYYAYSFDKCMEGGVLAPKKISLSTFAMDSLNSDSPKNQLYGIRMMHSFLQREPTKTQLLSKLTTSTETMARLINMLDWTSSNYKTVRLFAAKVTVELATNLRVVTIPGTMQIVSALLDADNKRKRVNPLLDADDDQQEERQDPVLNIANSLEERLDNQGQRQHPSRSTQQVGMHEQNSCILGCWQRISGFWSIPIEEPLADKDLLPALGMSILDSLAGCDQDNCVEISKATGLIPKIIGFTIYRSDMTNTDAQQKVLVKSSLKVLQRLTSIDGEIGITLRYKISKHPFLLRNLAEILGDSRSSQELRKLVAGILRNLAIDGNMRKEIGRIQLIISRLTETFLNTEEPTGIRKVTGQALAMLAIESIHNCMTMLKVPEFIRELKTMILIHDKYMYVAASLLRNLCLHARPELRELDLKELSHTLREVLERIMDAEGAELEVLIGLSALICKVIPGDFAREIEHGHIKQRFVQRLVDALNANMIPSACYPGTRRVILEQAIYMMECNSRYANCFKECRMTEALSLVEETPSKAENYMLFLGDTGFMEYSTPLSAVVDRAKELMGTEWLRGISSVN